MKEQGIEMMLEGEAEPVKDRMGSLEDNGHALLIVDMLNLKSKFKLRRYKVDLFGFFGAFTIVMFIILITLFLSRIGA